MMSNSPQPRSSSWNGNASTAARAGAGGESRGGEAAIRGRAAARTPVGILEAGVQLELHLLDAVRQVFTPRAAQVHCPGRGGDRGGGRGGGRTSKETHQPTHAASSLPAACPSTTQWSRTQRECTAAAAGSGDQRGRRCQHAPATRGPTLKPSCLGTAALASDAISPGARGERTARAGRARRGRNLARLHPECTNRLVCHLNQAAEPWTTLRPSAAAVGRGARSGSCTSVRSVARRSARRWSVWSKNFGRPCVPSA